MTYNQQSKGQDSRKGGRIDQRTRAPLPLVSVSRFSHLPSRSYTWTLSRPAKGASASGLLTRACGPKTKTGAKDRQGSALTRRSFAPDPTGLCPDLSGLWPEPSRERCSLDPRQQGGDTVG